MSLVSLADGPPKWALIQLLSRVAGRAVVPAGAEASLRVPGGSSEVQLEPGAGQHPDVGLLRPHKTEVLIQPWARGSYQ